MLLTTQNLAIGYNAQKVIFNDISLSAGSGDMIALLGINGIGKSTLLKTLIGIQKPISGLIQIDNINIHTLSIAQRSKYISVVLTDKIDIDSISVKEFIALGRSPYTDWFGQITEQDNQKIEESIHLLGIEKLANKYYNHLSDGEKQKVAIARAISQDTPLVVLDEPTAFLDFRSKKMLLQLLKSICIATQKIIILSTHDVEATYSYCNNWWLMKENKQFEQLTTACNYQKQIADKMFLEG